MTTTPPQGAQSADPVRDLIDKIKAACREKPTALNGYGLKLWEQIESALRTALAAPEGPAPTGWQTVSDEVVQSVADDLQREFGLTYGILSKCTLGSMLVDALRLSVSVTSARAPEAPPPVEARLPLNDARIDEIQREWISRGMSGSRSFARAIEAEVRAALAAPAGAIQPLRCDNCGKTIAGHDKMLHCYPVVPPVTPLPLDSAGGAPSATAKESE